MKTKNLARELKNKTSLRVGEGSYRCIIHVIHS